MKIRPNSLRPRMRGSRVQQAGLTLVELLVALVIGLVLLGTLVAVYANTSGSVAAAKVDSQMSEDAQYVLNVLTRQIRQAGYNPIQPNRKEVNGLPGGATAIPFFACDAGFSNASTTGGTAAADATALTCNGTAVAGGGGIAVTYEADVFNTIPTAATPPVPTDCLGNGLTQLSQMDAGPPISGPYLYYVTENRFYVKNNTLYCAGSGGATPFTDQPMIENVERIEFSYGAAHPTSGDKSIAGFLTSAAIGGAIGNTATNSDMAALATPAERWGKVVAVKVCVIMRSANRLAEESSSNFGCNPDADQTLVTSTDGYRRRAYITTVTLRNRMALP